MSAHKPPGKPVHTVYGAPETLAITGSSVRSTAGLDDSYKDTNDQPIDPRQFLAPPTVPGDLGRLAQYRILKVLGHGGMGMVFLAEDTKLLRMTAVKIMLPSHSDSSKAKDRFLREAQLAARVRHDNVVTIFQVGEENGVPFIAMELLKGFSLDAYLVKKGELGLGQAVRIAREVVDGLKAAHAVGLIHRDIKPPNIWLESPKGRVKLLDFGLAREEKADGLMSKTGAVIGTPKYMSPEQANGEKVDLRSDLYSLGVLLYRLCCGCEPFHGETMMSLRKAVMFDNPAPVRSLNPSVPIALEQLIVRLLAKKPADRPQSTDEVAQVLISLRTPSPSASPAPHTPRSGSVAISATTNVEESSEESAPAPRHKIQPVVSQPEPDDSAAMATEPPRRRWSIFVAIGFVLGLLLIGFIIALPMIFNN